jgi:lysozyme family protein
MTFDRAFDVIVGQEGGYVNDPRDPGGETKFGISKRAYPDEDIPNMTLERAKEIYSRDYWLVLRCDAMPWPLSLFVFDCGVNQGVMRATMLLQTTLRVKTDGEIGPVTLAAIAAANQRELAATFMGYRAISYSKTGGFAIYGRGWFNRLFRVCLSTGEVS